MAERRILVVEDDEAIRSAIVAALSFEGFESIECDRGDEGARLAVELEIDLALLDVMMPGMDGFDVLERVRESRPELPVIMLTARGEEPDRVRGLKLGADDYVVKPFSKAELMARVEAVLRRSAERPTDVSCVRLAHCACHLDRRVVEFDDGSREELSEQEAGVLRYLAMHAGRVVSRDELIDRVWRLEPVGLRGTRTVDMCVARLRSKLRDEEATVIRTVRGKGYALEGATIEDDA